MLFSCVPFGNKHSVQVPIGWNNIIPMNSEFFKSIRIYVCLLFIKILTKLNFLYQTWNFLSILKHFTGYYWCSSTNWKCQTIMREMRANAEDHFQSIWKIAEKHCDVNNVTPGSARRWKTERIIQLMNRRIFTGHQFSYL